MVRMEIIELRTEGPLFNATWRSLCFVANL